METILAQALGQDASQLATEEKQRLLSRLLARLAHEIRNPLSSLDIHAQLLAEDVAQMAPAVRDKLAGRLEIIHGELHRLESIVKHFLRLAGPSALELEEVTAAGLIQYVRDLLQPEAAAREIELVTQLDEGLPPFTADAGQLTQALLNLMINALQAVERRGRVEVRAFRPGVEPFLLIEVRDNGPGVPPEKRAAIFEPFFTTKPEGSGLGLWIAQQIVAAHQGDLQAANRPEGGAVFTVRLPLRTEEKAGGQG